MTTISIDNRYCFSTRRLMGNRYAINKQTATFNNISVIPWQSVLLVEEPSVPGENNRPATSHWQTLSENVVSSTRRHERDSNSQRLWWYAPISNFYNTIIPQGQGQQHKYSVDQNNIGTGLGQVHKRGGCDMFDISTIKALYLSFYRNFK